MKYLVLLLMFFMVSNVKADISLMDMYRSYSYKDKLKMLDMCRIGHYNDRKSDATDKMLYELKGDICLHAYTFLREQQEKEYNIDKKTWLMIEQYQMIVKAANFYYLGNINTNTANQLKEVIHHAYNNMCLNNSEIDFYFVASCEILLTYKGLDIGNIR